MAMGAWIAEAGNALVYIATVIGAIIAIYRAVVKPIKKFMADIKDSLVSIRDDIKDIQDEIGDVVCDRLHQARDYHIGKRWCARDKKQRLLDMYRRYKSKGRNHMTDRFADELLELPDEPPGVA